jgi:hypothetical protein
MVRDLLQLNTFHKRVIVALIGIFCAFAVTYGVLVRETVAHVVARRVLEESTTQMAGDVSVLEGKYMAAGDSLTLSRAHALGFVDSNVALFVSRHVNTYSFRTAAE